MRHIHAKNAQKKGALQSAPPFLRRKPDSELIGPLAVVCGIQTFTFLFFGHA